MYYLNEYKKLPTLYIFVCVCVCVCVCTATGSRVTLTVHNEVRNISCNKRIVVTLLCEGVNLTQLRWLYLPIDHRIIFLSDSFPQNTSMSVFPNNPESDISRVQLLDIRKNTSNNSSNHANFSSILTVDLLQLLNQNVTKIECGDAVLNEEKLVLDLVDGVVKLEPKVTATYQKGVLNNIQVQVKNLVCIKI